MILRTLINTFLATNHDKISKKTSSELSKVSIPSTSKNLGDNC